MQLKMKIISKQQKENTTLSLSFFNGFLLKKVETLELSDMQ